MSLPTPSRPGRRGLSCLLGALALFAVAAGAHAQSDPFPSKPVRIIAPFPAGGPIDLIARVLGEKMSPALRQPVIVENRPGAGGIIATDYVAKSAPDGLTLLIVANTLVILPHLDKAATYDPFRDFQPVAMAVSIPNVLVVHPGAGVKNVQDVVTLARKTPGGLSYASAGSGSPLHLAGELFARATGAPMTHVPYKGAGPAVTDLMAGQVKVMFAPLGPVMALIRSGKVVPIAVTDPRRSPQLPEVPTVTEAGVGGVEASSWICFVAPAKTPAVIVARLNQEINAALAAADVRERFRSQGLEPTGGTPAALAQALREDYDKFGKLISEAGIKLE